MVAAFPGHLVAQRRRLEVVTLATVASVVALVVATGGCSDEQASSGSPGSASTHEPRQQQVTSSMACGKALDGANDLRRAVASVMPWLTDQVPASPAAALPVGEHGIACLVQWSKLHLDAFAIEPDVRSIDEALGRGSHLAGTIACLDGVVERARWSDGDVHFTMVSSTGRTSAGWLVEDTAPLRGTRIFVCGAIVGRYGVAPDRSGVFLVGRRGEAIEHRGTSTLTSPEPGPLRGQNHDQ